MSNIKWIQEWYLSQCDGEWEHDYGIRIRTVDNPGWNLEIDLEFTDLENIDIPWTLEDKDENDWYGFKIENHIFSASGDSGKLEFLLKKFIEIAEKHKK